jgi:1,4-alpha-glucan branching enzyme
MFAHPGKKLLFMGGEFAVAAEWNHDAQLEWQLLEDPLHAGVSRLVGDCNRLYRTTPALHELDAEPAGFEWLDFADAAHSVLAFARKGRAPEGEIVVAVNATPVVRYGYRLGVPASGAYGELLNTDSAHYGGTNVGNEGLVSTQPIPAHGRAQSVALTLPPLAAVVFARERPS